MNRKELKQIRKEDYWKNWRPHLFLPKQYWRLEVTGWVLFGWMIVIIGWLSGW